MAREAVERRDLRQAQLFIDDTWVEDSEYVGRIFHQPKKLPNPVLVGDRSWERYCPVTYGTVLRWRDKFRMWYVTWTRSSPCKVCYAESQDGVYWDKPNLGLCSFAGARDNNIVYQAPDGGIVDCIAVIDDPDDGAWPLKAILWESRKSGFGLSALRSRDGLQWDATQPILPDWGDRTTAMPAREDGKFVILGRAPDPLAVPRFGRRVVWRTESDDLAHWSKPELVMKSDAEDPPRLQIYSLAGFRYESLRLGFIERMYVVPDKLDLELAYSFDGRVWQRTRPRPAFLPWGAPGSWDSTWIAAPTNGVICHQGGLWCYYSGRSGAHAVQEPQNYGAIGLATMRLDGFASMCATEAGGWMQTPAFTWPAGDLLLNMDPRADLTGHPGHCTGEIGVAVLTADGAEVAGYGLEDCVALRQNTQRLDGHILAPVRWAEGRSLDGLAGRQLKLHFRLRDAHLYSFRAGEFTAR